ncbi:DUF4367 domain-containing protein [Sedimentibacter sp.]|uniref:DUF4367 domain-containing protein n=1 Tax=Sedimentibacter sp. TaxID=1960295 RepID=UPI00289BBB28|nr:DUF4367 domain-containing protein [Sedimentibacter sp.]
MKNITDEELDILLTEHMPKANMLLAHLEEERDKNVAPHVFSERYKKKMKKVIKEYSRTSAQIKFAAFRKYAAAVLIIFILTNSFLILTVEAYRTRVFKIITTIYNTHTSIVTEIDNGPINESPEFIEPSYVPEGFEIIDEMQSDITRIIDYANDNKILVYKQSIITSSELVIDTEGTEIKEIKVGKYNINYVFNKGMHIAYWYDSEYSYLITGEIPFEELLKVIESVIKK